MMYSLYSFIIICVKQIPFPSDQILFYHFMIQQFFSNAFHMSSFSWYHPLGCDPLIQDFLRFQGITILSCFPSFGLPLANGSPNGWYGNRSGKNLRSTCAATPPPLPPCRTGRSSPLSNAARQGERVEDVSFIVQDAERHSLAVEARAKSSVEPPGLSGCSWIDAVR